MVERDIKAVKYVFLGLFLILLFFSISLYSNRESKEPPSRDEQNPERLVARVFKSAPNQGTPNAKILLIEHGDFQCPFCAETQSVIDQILEKHGRNLQHVWIHTPNVTEHPQAFAAAKAAQCANIQGKFWEYKDALFEKNGNLTNFTYNSIAEELGLSLGFFESCLEDPTTDSTIHSHLRFSQQAQVSATPHISINDKTLTGLFTFDEVDKLIQQELEALTE